MELATGGCASASNGLDIVHCTYTVFDPNHDPVPGAHVRWEVRAGLGSTATPDTVSAPVILVPLHTPDADGAGHVLVDYSIAVPPEGASLLMCATTLPAPCRLLVWTTIHFL